MDKRMFGRGALSRIKLCEGNSKHYTWGIQEGTTPQMMFPVEEDQCFLPEVRSNDESVEPKIESKYITGESLGCEPNNQVLEDTQGEQIQMRTITPTISRFLKPPVRIIC